MVSPSRTSPETRDSIGGRRIWPLASFAVTIPVGFNRVIGDVGLGKHGLSGAGINRSLKSAQMARVRTQHTAPEMAVRRALHRRGLRFRLHRRDLPGRPDIVLPRFKMAIFVHGCYWHGCTMCDRGVRRPKTNMEFWSAKLDENRRRDERNQAELHELGWHPITVWECETRTPDKLQTTLDRILSCVAGIQE